MQFRRWIRKQQINQIGLDDYFQRVHANDKSLFAAAL